MVSYGAAFGYALVVLVVAGLALLAIGVYRRERETFVREPFNTDTAPPLTSCVPKSLRGCGGGPACAPGNPQECCDCARGIAPGERPPWAWAPLDQVANTAGHPGIRLRG